MGYNFERFCKDYENIENFENAKADNFKNWNCHHRLETHNPDGERRTVDITVAELKSLGMYYNRPASELIFLTSSEHGILHNKGKHRPVSEETRRRMSEVHKGHLVSEETRRRISEAKKNMSTETRRKLSEANKGKHLSEETKKKLSEAHKGKSMSEEARRKMSEARKNMSAETRRKMSEAMKGKRLSEETKHKISKALKGKPGNAKGMRWFNNGKINIRVKECPDGFVPGRLK